MRRLLQPRRRSAWSGGVSCGLDLAGRGPGAEAEAGAASVPRGMEFDPRLVEESVLRLLQGHQLEQAFRSERDRVYTIEDAEEREQGFRAVHWVWFERLGLARPMERAFAEQSGWLEKIDRTLVLPATAAHEEGAELFVNPAEGTQAMRRRLVLQLRPETLCRPKRALELLRSELFHIADMLDPSFGYLPNLELGEGERPGFARQLRDRYKVLWDLTIAGRQLRRGWLGADARERCRAEFGRTFPMLGDGLGAAFALFFERPRPSHAELAAFARAPLRAAAHGADTPRGQCCPLCRLPAFTLLGPAALLSPVVIDKIRADFSSWEPRDGFCRQCADLYIARATAQ